MEVWLQDISYIGFCHASIRKVWKENDNSLDMALTQQDISYIGFCHASICKVWKEDDNSLDMAW